MTKILARTGFFLRINPCVFSIVDLPIGFSSPEFFTDPETPYPVAVVQNELQRFKNIRELHLLIAEEKYGLDCPTARILLYVFTRYISRLSTLFLEIYGSEALRLELENFFGELGGSVSEFSRQHDKLKTIKIWITHSLPKRLLLSISPLFSRFVTGVERIELRSRSNLEVDLSPDQWMPDSFFIYDLFESKSVKFAAIEDKFSDPSVRPFKYIRKAWPNLVELELDLGVNHRAEHYADITSLEHIQKLELMYPYYSWTSEVQENMAEEARQIAKVICLGIPTLQEISMKYMGGDGSKSQTAVFDCIHTEAAPPEGAEPIENIELELKELWNMMGDYHDTIMLMRLMRNLGYDRIVTPRIARYVLIDELKLDGLKFPQGNPYDHSYLKHDRFLGDF
ncbi:hypothetical protein TWF730_005865 [Orbilia blumenaviensis]|uniref:Uncharacterized protein n=1 Tax=Orbilia blumenaviensis TaxID=1796055 RepID=A0AAV9VLY9_9PEZI